ncbi:hypothetical protein Hanom_Chr06g00563311 [Helianthus anomalus]
MGRKGKAEAGSSSNLEDQPKRRRLILQRDVQDEEEEQQQQEEEEEYVVDEKLKWTSGSLVDQPKKKANITFLRSNEFFDQPKRSFHMREGSSGKRFWSVWDLKCYYRDEKNLFAEEIQEWMATLKCPPYKKASQMKLIGMVNGIDVEMSFDTLRLLAKFDSKPSNKYMFPSLNDLYFEPDKHPMWNAMLEALFLPGTRHGKLYPKI